MENYEALNLKQKISENDSFTIERYRQFYHFLPKKTKYILDVGCNTGRGGAELKRLNNEFLIYGIDIVEDRLKRLPKNVYHEYILGSTTEIPWEDNYFDAVVAGEFIEHLYSQDVTKTLAEVFRVLNIGGKILLTTPNPNDWKRKLRKGTILGGAHVSQHFPKILKLQLMMAGFSNVKIFGSGKVTRYLGYRFPLLSIYGSYLAVASKY
jgi:ubiquinone/menaquinone biosynthesis C-methylase UbiE